MRCPHNTNICMDVGMLSNINHIHHIFHVPVCLPMQHLMSPRANFDNRSITDDATIMLRLPPIYTLATRYDDIRFLSLFFSPMGRKTTDRCRPRISSSSHYILQQPLCFHIIGRSINWRIYKLSCLSSCNMVSASGNYSPVCFRILFSSYFDILVCVFITVTFH